MEFKTSSNEITLTINGVFAGKITFVKENENTYKIPLVYVDPNFRGQKLGSLLVQQLVNYARQNNFKLNPVCPFAQKEFNNNESYNDILSK